MSRWDAATPLPDPPQGWAELIFPCRWCGATHCPCVFPAPPWLRKLIADRHRASLHAAARNVAYQREGAA